MEDYKFTQFDFERPPWIQLIAEEIIFNLLGNILWYGPLVRSIEIKGDEKLLDFGCGSGFLIKYMAGSRLKEGKITGVDSSKFYIQRARKKLKRFKNVELVSDGIDSPDIPGNYYDIITINYVIHDISPGKRQDIVSKLAEKLNHKGKICISEPTKISHGIAVDEIRNFFSGAGLNEKTFKHNRSRYTGCWEK